MSRNRVTVITRTQRNRLIVGLFGSALCVLLIHLPLGLILLLVAIFISLQLLDQDGPDDQPQPRAGLKPYRTFRWRR